MRAALLALLLTTQLAHAHREQADAESRSHLGAHQHGAMQLDVVIEANTLHLQLISPAMDLIGFEHSATTDQQQQAANALRRQLAEPQTLFGFGPGQCTVLESSVEGGPFTARTNVHGHSDVQAHYRLDCAKPAALTYLDASQWFKQFAKTEKIAVQLITPNQQLGAQLTPDAARLTF